MSAVLSGFSPLGLSLTNRPQSRRSASTWLPAAAPISLSTSASLSSRTSIPKGYLALVPPRLQTTDALCHRFLPGHIHAFYVEYVYYDRAEQAREGRFASRPAPGVYSERVQTGGQGYGTMAQPTN